MAAGLRGLQSDTDVISALLERVATLEGLAAGRLAQGRVVQVENAAARPTSGLFPGLVVYEVDKTRWVVWTGTAWQRWAHATPAGRTFFRVDKTTNQGIGASSLTTPSWDTESDPDAAISAGSFTVPAGCAGLWGFQCQMSFTTVVATTNAAVRFLVSGSARDFAGNPQLAGNMAATFTAYLTAGQTVVAQVFTAVAGTLTSGSYFEGELIHP